MEVVLAVVDERFKVVEDTLLVADVDAVTVVDVDLVVLLVEEGNVVEVVAVAVAVGNELDEASEEVVKAENEEDKNVDVDPKGVVLTE